MLLTVYIFWFVMKPDETILLYVGMSRKIHASMLCKSTRNTSSQKSRKAKRGSSENNRKLNRPEGKQDDERKKQRQKQQKKVALPGIEPVPQLPPAPKVRPRTTEPCDKFTGQYLKLIV